MKHIVPAVLLLVALLHALPLAGVLGAPRLLALYGVDAHDPNLALLLRHRAVLFGLLAAGLAVAALRPPLHAAGLVAGLVSVAAFLLLALLEGPLNAALATVVRLDIAALILLLAAGLVHLLRPVTPMTATLAALRKSRRVSQLELSLRTGVSQRHLSCIETGRSRAGRETLFALLDALGATLEERNQALLAAGYAPAHTERALDAPEMAPVRAALEQLIHANGAAPALVLDGEYNVVMGNAGLARLLALLGLPADMLAQPLNLLRAVFAPGGLRSLCVDEAWLCNEMWARASREAEHLPRLRALLDELRPTLEPWVAREAAGNLPVLAFRLRAADGRVLSFFSTVTSFGTPLDITLASLKVEHLFPTDDETRRALADQPVQ